MTQSFHVKVLGVYKIEMDHFHSGPFNCVKSNENGFKIFFLSLPRIEHFDPKKLSFALGFCVQFSNNHTQVMNGI